MFNCTRNSEEKKAAKQKQELIEEGQKIAKESGKALVEKLSNAIATKGVTEAIEFCSENAYELTDSLSKAYNVKISRVSHKNRNPKNQANVQELALIKDYQKKQTEGRKLEPSILNVGDHKVFYSPIIINNSICLNCHGKIGEDITDENYITLQILYPDDKATGFEMNDIRGLWKIVFKANKPES